MRKALQLFLVWCLWAPCPGALAADDAQSGDSGDEFSDEMAGEFTDDEDYVIIADPLEPVNRAIFWFNDKLYFYLLKPVAKAYRVVPKGARISVANFFSNLGTPIRLVNSALQLKFDAAGTELLRFVVNTTVGIGGLFDPARNYGGIRQVDEDFGQTLGSYGVGPGFYLVLPVIGSSSGRDGVGYLADSLYLDPIVLALDDPLDRLAVKTVDGINQISLDKDTYESIVRDSLDPYTFIKNAYAQNREGMIAK